MNKFKFIIRFNKTNLNLGFVRKRKSIQKRIIVKTSKLEQLENINFFKYKNLK
jgi:hypothetical protein